jgi:hypothetical protein
VITYATAIAQQVVTTSDMVLIVHHQPNVMLKIVPMLVLEFFHCVLQEALGGKFDLMPTYHKYIHIFLIEDVAMLEMV